jgi:hypothetical protein
MIDHGVENMYAEIAHGYIGLELFWQIVDARPIPGIAALHELLVAEMRTAFICNCGKLLSPSHALAVALLKCGITSSAKRRIEASASSTGMSWKFTCRLILSSPPQSWS